MLGFLNKFLDSNEKQVNKLQPLVLEVGSFENKIQKLTDAKLKAKTAEFKLRFEKGTSLEDLLPVAYAAGRAAAKRSLNQRHFNV